MERFLGRERELASLREELINGKPSLVVVYGRRRVGKSRLVREAAAGLPGIYFQATRIEKSLNLEQFKIEIGRVLDGSDPILDALGDWDGVLHYLAEIAKSRHPGLVVTLDEFPYLVESDEALPSIVQRFWDLGKAADGRLKLILCGSHISQMEELLAERNPLYGRKTMAMDVRPLPLRDAAEFLPNYSDRDKVEAYAIFGGMPYYLESCDPDVTLETNVERLLLSPSGRLVEEAISMLQVELREPRRYSSILMAIADGCTQTSEISGRIRELPASQVSPYIDVLNRLRLVRTVRSLDAALRERDRRHQIMDPLLRFWHRFVRPNLSPIIQGKGADVMRYQIRPKMSEYMGSAFEDICRSHAEAHIQELTGIPAQTVGQIWAGNYDIDVAGRLLDDSYFYGECKWTNDPIRASVLDKLRERSDTTSYRDEGHRRTFLLYSRSGFSEELLSLARSDRSIKPIGLDGLLRPPAETYDLEIEDVELGSGMEP